MSSVAGEARSSAASWTMTSYCSPFISKRVTWRPPSSVSSVRPTTVTSRPRSATLARSISMRNSGLLSFRSVSTLSRPGIVARCARAACRHSPAAPRRCPTSGCTNSIGPHRAALAEGAGVGARTPARRGCAASFGHDLARDVLLRALAVVPVLEPAVKMRNCDTSGCAVDDEARADLGDLGQDRVGLALDSGWCRRASRPRVRCRARAGRRGPRPAPART